MLQRREGGREERNCNVNALHKLSTTIMVVLHTIYIIQDYVKNIL